MYKRQAYTLQLTGQFGAEESASVDIGLTNVDTTSADYSNFIAAVNVAIAGYSGNGTVTFDGSTLTFTATNDGDSMSNLPIDLGAFDDAFVEGDENYTVAISNPASTTGGEIITSSSAITTTITDNDIATFSITGDATVGEGADAKYAVTLAGTLQAGETASIELAIGNTDTTSTDYANFVTAVNDAVAAYTGPGALAFNGTTLTFTSDGAPMGNLCIDCLLYTSPSPRDLSTSRMPSSA